MKKRYENPPILDGYKHVEGRWNNGFVIERITDGSQFVWVPVGSLDADGTLDGKNFTQKFGRRNYRKDRFLDSDYNEPLDEELAKQIGSVIRNEGFYISRYNISKSLQGKPQSVKGVMPWGDINFEDTKKTAAAFENKKSLKSHLTYGAEYDSVLAWFIKSKARTLEEIVGNSSEWGNHLNGRNSVGEMVKAGSKREWTTNNICDFAGNVDEWTQERNAKSYRVIRGCSCNYSRGDSSVANRDYYYPTVSFPDTGFRIALYIE